MLEQLLDPDRLIGLGSQPITDLRNLRVSCSEAEGDVSLVRRLAQGRLDIVGHELRRRAGESVESDISNLLFDMPDILGSESRSSSAIPGARPIDLSGPGQVAGDLTDKLDSVVSPDALATVGEQGDSAVRQMFEQLRSIELELSTVRRRLHEQIDAIQSEIARRYRDGEASVDSLL